MQGVSGGDGEGGAAKGGDDDNGDGMDGPDNQHFEKICSNDKVIQSIITLKAKNKDEKIQLQKDFKDM